jgi:AraC-like DNA-binding protein
MPFETHYPDRRLSPMILSYWRLDGLTPGRLYTSAPKRHVELVINVGAPQIASGAVAPAAKEYGSCWITGLRDSALYLVPTGTSIIYGIRFGDFAVPQWLNASMARNPCWSTDLAGSMALMALVRKIGECSNMTTAAAIFDAFLLSHAREALPIDRLRQAISTCERHGSLTPAGIQRQMGGSSRQARRLAYAAAGISLRRFARLARFDRALIQLHSEPAIRLADIAHDVGYYDEAHMAHDFAAFCGTAPAAYRRRRLEAGDTLPHHLVRTDC